MRVLVIIVSHEMSGSLPNIRILKQFMDQSGHTVDYAGISSRTDFSNFEHILPFKYKFTCTLILVPKSTSSGRFLAI